MVAKVEPDNFHETASGPLGYASHRSANEETRDQG
jgi:hypothetical protein